ncbi:DUF397 domain-containing protein [Nocardiopsis aegyptia]|uniref:DUF397 domain-containing protein n=1 Tax=Nocardiopsis aegyptia TaxID=220378 RepID=A0A7Z0ERT2_9ACTN|nr:DUF397 domain-containing protein [Nocardiopsis aegyptia]NYJ36561.1 hypothetical protein [Nocardiopsis aegyptia]
MNHEWRTSSYSPNGSDCVEARHVTRVAEVRDSKNPADATLAVPTAEWTALLAGVRSPA